jgi:hypothetical protein
MRRRWQILVFPALLLLNYAVIQHIAPGQPQRVEVSYTFFKQQVEADNVVEISTRADTVQGTFRSLSRISRIRPSPPGPLVIFRQWCLRLLTPGWRAC